MNATSAVQDWVSANQRCLMLELAALSRLLGGETGDLAELEAARAELPAPSALDTLCALFGLSEFERRLLLLCAGVELEGEFASRCAAAPGSLGNAWPSFGLALAAFPNAHWDALAHTAPLRRWRMIEVTGSGPLVAAALRIDERILFHLSGLAPLDERLMTLIRPVSESSELSPSQTQACDRLLAALQKERRSPVLQLCGSDPVSKRAVAAHVAHRMPARLFALNAAALPTAPVDLDLLQRLWEREALLQNAALLLECDRVENPEPARDVAIDRWIEMSRTPLFVSTLSPRINVERAMVTIDLAKPSKPEQRRAWEEALGAAAAGLNGELDRVTAQFDFSATAIRTAAGRSGEGGLWEACRLHARPKLADLAQHIPSHARWDDLVLPELQLRTLHTIAGQVRHRTKVYDDWGFADQTSRGLGLSALFAGPSGTGKTLAAEILANELKLDLFRIDLSAVVSKYIGETEKNLRRVFDAAEEGGAVLLFDEADALFGKRSEVKDSHDRYANVEVSYLLQRMEAYRGLAILTTNMKEALDPAFLRRLRFVVQFPFPDQALRTEIWRRIFPARTPTEGLDVGALSRLSISGGNIRSIALNSAFTAAADDRPVRMSDLLEAARLEYGKLEKTLTEAELGGWR
jgi:hypothetical protein